MLEANILIIDDDLETVEPIIRYVQQEGHHVQVAYDSAEALDLLAKETVHFVFLDWVLEQEIGLEVLATLHAKYPALDIVILSEGASLEMATQAISAGAYDIVRKERVADAEGATDSWAVPPRIPVVLTNLLNRWQQRDVLALHLDEKYRLVGNSAPIQDLFEEIDRVAATDLTVLIHGESGTGKELVAHNIHRRSGRSGGPFVPVNCSALTATLIESELFGHEKGAFTGASAARPGKFELASGGTLFLDEIGDLSLEAQAKLLRVLEDKTVLRVGGTKSIATDTRVICATNRDIDARVAAGEFREDLRFRLGYKIVCAPLRDRRDDLQLLSEYVLASVCLEIHRPVPTLTADGLATLRQYDWPGNVRQLRNVLQWAALRAGAEIDGELLAAHEDLGGAGAAPTTRYDGLTLREAARAFEMDLISRVLAQSKSKREAARTLGVDEGNFNKKLKQLGLS